MPPPPLQITTDTSARDAEIIRRKAEAAKREIMEQLGIPQTSVVGDPAREAKLEESSKEVAEITAKLALLTKVVPASIPRNILIFFAGVKKTPTGDTKVVPVTGTNFAPAPIGYLDPTSVGLKRNFYLPSGSSVVIPGILDQFGLGLPEQRSDDAARAAQLRETTATSAQRTARRVLQNEPDDVIADIAAGQGGFTRAGRIRATSGVATATLQEEAGAELERRRLAREPAPVIGPTGVDGAMAASASAEASATRLVNERREEVSAAGVFGLGELFGPDALFAALPPDP